MIKQDTCRSIYHQVDGKAKITKSNLCALSSTGDSCEGDSGGGLVIQNKEKRLDLCLQMFSDSNIDIQVF